MESDEKRIDAEISEDQENMVEDIGGGTVLEGEGAKNGGSITERVKVSKRGRPRKDNGERKSQESEESYDLCVENWEFEEKKQALSKRGGMKKKGESSGVVKGNAVGGVKKRTGRKRKEGGFEDGLENKGGVDVVEMENNEEGDAGERNNLVEENKGWSGLTVEQGKKQLGWQKEVGKDSLGNGLEDHRAETQKPKPGQQEGQNEEDIRGEKAQGREFRKVNDKVGMTKNEEEEEEEGVSRIRKAMEDEEEGFSRKGKRRGGWRKKMNDAEPNYKQNRGEAKAQEEDGKTKPTKRRSDDEAMGDSEGEGQKVSGEARRSCRTKKVKPENVAKPRVGLKRNENGFLESNMCHQCQRNDKGRVVRCTKCKTKRYCVPCMTTWYPKMSEEAFAEACPVCRMNCNCKACLRMEAPVNVISQIQEKSDVKISEDEKVQYSRYIIEVLLPFLEQINAEQMMEQELEAKLQGVSVSDIKLKKAACDEDERMYCDNCRTSIVDYHRSCPLCSYDLCLSCCRELRDGHLQGGEKGTPLRYFDYGIEYLHGEKNIDGLKSGSPIEVDLEDNVYSPSEWKSKENGIIPCPQTDRGGCGQRVLQLKCLFPRGQVSKLLVEARQIIDKHKQERVPEFFEKSCSCSKSLGQDDILSQKSCKAASREDSYDNALYCPTAVDIKHEDLKHFQWHWSKGEPVIVSNVLGTTLGLSWEPMVMWRAFRQIKNLEHDQLLDVTAINCLDWCEIIGSIACHFSQGFPCPSLGSCLQLNAYLFV